MGSPAMTTAPTLSTEPALAFADRVWEGEILPALAEYIRIPNKSQHFDPSGASTGTWSGRSR